MQKAVGKVIDEKKEEEIGTNEAEADVAADLHAAAQEDTRTRDRQQREKGGIRAGSRKTLESRVPRMGTGTHCVEPDANPRFSRGQLTADLRIAINCVGDIGALRRSERVEEGVGRA
jgi:3-phenylpropionate/cinnamic acid dioxygenase small subunit